MTPATVFDLDTFDGMAAFAAHARGLASGPLAALDVTMVVDPAMRGCTVRPSGRTLHVSRRAMRLYREYADRLPDDATPAGAN